MTTRNDLPDLAHRLILRAAHQAPPALAERLEEEWLADLGSRSGSLSRLRLAIGCCWATSVITRDFGVPQLAVSGVSARHKPLRGVVWPDLPVLSRRTMAFLLIAALHVAVIYAFMTGLAQHVVAAFPELTHAVFLEEAPREHLAPALLDPYRPRQVQSEPQDPFDPNLIKEPQPPDPIPATVTEGNPVNLEPSVLQPQRGISRVWGGPGKGFPDTDIYYPPESRRLSETGSAMVGVCVDTHGYLTGAPTLAVTSGNRRIDEGALRLAQAGSGRYRPTTDDGKAVSACYSYRIRFELN